MPPGRPQSLCYLEIALAAEVTRSLSYFLIHLSQSEKSFPSLSLHPVFHEAITKQLLFTVLLTGVYHSINCKAKVLIFSSYLQNHMYCNCSISFPKLESPQPWKHIRIFLFWQICHILYFLVSSYWYLPGRQDLNKIRFWDTIGLYRSACVERGEKSNNYNFSLWAAEKYSSWVLRYLSWFSNFFLVYALGGKTFLSHYFQDCTLLAMW